MARDSGIKQVTQISLFYRPVVALVEIEIQKVDRTKQGQVHDVVMKAMGPADPTIVVTSDESGDEDPGVDVSELLEAVEPYGTVVLVRYVRYSVSVKRTPFLKCANLSGKKKLFGGFLELTLICHVLLVSSFVKLRSTK